MAAIFPNANKTQINGGQFFIDNRRSANRDAFDLLRQYCAIGAMLDSNERFHPPRCAPETRKALIDEVLAWIYGGDESASMAWLFGGAGAGKSALGQTVAEILQKDGRLAGSFFFSRTSTAERSDGNRLIPTLVFQLISAFPPLKLYIEERVHMDGGLLDRSARTQMDQLFIEPLVALKQQTLDTQTASTPTSQPPSISKTSKPRRRDFVAKILRRTTMKNGISTEQPPPSLKPDIATSSDLHNLLQHRLIVIDGLDECNGQDIQVDLLRILAHAIPRLPIPLRILIASRPEGPITRTFDHDEAFQRLSIYRISLSDDKNASSDIWQFLIQGFEEIHRTHPLRAFLSPSWPSQNDINALVQKSSSHFIYASTAMKYIQYPRGMPNDRLEVILGLSVPPTTDKPFAQLDALYIYIFTSLEESDRMSVNSVFGIMHLSREDSEIGRSPAKLEKYLGMRAGEINLLLEPLFSLVALPNDRDDGIIVMHASLFDFLLDASRSGGLCLDLEIAHGIIANSSFKRLIETRLDTLLDDTAALRICWSFLFHIHDGVLSEGVKDYLTSFPVLYDVILHSKFLMQHLNLGRVIVGWSYIFIILEFFFDLLISKGFDNSQYLHAFHALQVEQRFQSIRKDLGHGDSDVLDDMAQEPLFNNVQQNAHRVYKAYLNLCLAPNGIESFSGILERILVWYGPKNLPENLRSHCMIISLPHLTREDIYICTKYATKTATRYSDVRLVLQQRVVEYLQRIEQDADPLKLNECKQAWGITPTLYPLVPPGAGLDL